MRVDLVQDKEVLGVGVAMIRRGLLLQVRPHSSNVYYVTGGSEPHWVNMADPMVPRCDCVDHLARDRLCKHMVAVLAHCNDKRLWDRLRELEWEGESGG